VSAAAPGAAARPGGAPAGPVASAANRFDLCAGAAAFVEALRAELAHCHESLWVQFSTFEGDASGTELADLLLAQAARGVDVRLLVDHYSDVIVNDILPSVVQRRRALDAGRTRTAALLARLEAGGVGVRRTAPPGRFRRYLLYRDHKKMVVVDGRVAFVGGLNVSDHNYAWRDFMVRIEGPLATDVASDFAATWDARRVSLDRSGPGDFALNQAPGRASIGEEVVAMIGRAQRTIVLESPSLLGDRVEAALVAAARRGVDVTLIAPARHNRWIFRVWVRATHRRLARVRVTIHGYRGSGGMTHAKLLLVDDRASFGSYNFFELEGLTQKELNIFTADPTLVTQLRALVSTALADSAIVPAPTRTFGRFSYRLVERVVVAWTRRLLRDPSWKARYA